jgi:hypothetical protein
MPATIDWDTLIREEKALWVQQDRDAFQLFLEQLGLEAVRILDTRNLASAWQARMVREFLSGPVTSCLSCRPQGMVRVRPEDRFCPWCGATLPFMTGEQISSLVHVILIKDWEN